MNKPFQLIAEFAPTGDQPEAIEALCSGLSKGRKFQTLEGVTGSGKTFTMANVIAHYNRPALVISHNKTLAAQLYEEFKDLFPETYSVKKINSYLSAVPKKIRQIMEWNYVQNKANGGKK